MTLKHKAIKPAYLALKKVLFLQDAEKVHGRFTKLGKELGANKATRKITSGLFNYQNPALEQNIKGIKFKNPIGLAAGFDYEAKLIDILPSVGFGFHTIGSVTLNSYEGNTPPRMGRLPKSKSLLVNKGLKSEGTKKVIETTKQHSPQIPLGFSVAKTNSKENCDDKTAIKDYVESLKLIERSKVANYYEINISCPNAFGGESFTTPARLSKLLREIDKLKIKKPVFLKMPVDFSTKQTDDLLKVASRYNIAGIIFGNLTKNRNNPLLHPEEIKKIGKGNFSGLPTRDISNNLIKFTYKKYKNRFIIIGCGGVFTAEDAYKKIKLGASLIEMITGMIYNGPGVIGEINSGIVKLMKKDGFTKISEAVGKDNQS